jgi:hypothetical protein
MLYRGIYVMNQIKFTRSHLLTGILPNEWYFIRPMSKLSAPLRNRRHFLSGSLLALGAMVVHPATAGAAELVPNWMTRLEDTLRTYCSSMERKLSASGAMELHCAMSDPVAFGTSHGNFAGLGLRIMAQGNKLTLRKDGHSVSVFINPVVASL